MYLIENVDRYSTDIAPGGVDRELTEVSVDTTEIILIRPTIACEQQTYFRSSLLSLPKINVCEPERQNDFPWRKTFVLMLANQIRRHFLEGEKRQPEIRLLFSGYPTKDIEKEQQKKRLFYPKYFEVKPAQKIRTNIAMTSVGGYFQVFSEPQALSDSNNPQWSQLNCKLLHKQLCIIVLDNTATSVVLKNHPWKAVYMPFQFGN